MATKTRASLPRVELLHVFVPTGRSGRLAKDGQHSFTYDTAALEATDAAAEISLTMPLSAQSYSRTPMLPAFQTFLPEGYLKERIHERFGKLLRIDDMALLALSGGNAIGRLRVSRERDIAPPTWGSEDLREILADQGSRDLFEYLADTYLIQSGIAGVQPKVLLAARDHASDRASDEARARGSEQASDRASDRANAEADRRRATEAPPASFPRSRAATGGSIGERATLRGRQLIVKASGPDFPHLSENEFHCLDIARRIGLGVPQFWLSADRKRLVVERFDYDRDRDLYLGFEDMVSLQGTVNDRKYEGSYESIAKAIRLNAASGQVRQSLREFYSVLVLNVVLRNGDAHLKNFGLLYTHPGADDCRLSPLYDVICTTVYLVKDLPALALCGRRAWPARKDLAAFGRAQCNLEHPETTIDEIVAAAMDYRPADDESGIWRQMRAAIERGLPALAP